MTTLIERAAELTDAAERLVRRKAAAADASALTDALERFRGERKTLKPAAERAKGAREHGLRMSLPSNGKGLADDLRAFAKRVDADPTAVRDRRTLVDRVEAYVQSVSDEVECVLSAHVDSARGSVDAGLVPSLRAIGLSAAADSVRDALEVLNKYGESLPRTADALSEVDAAAERIHGVLNDIKAPEKAALVGFIQQVSRAPLPLDQLDPEVLVKLNESGAAKNFVIRARDAT